MPRDLSERALFFVRSTARSAPSSTHAYRQKNLPPTVPPTRTREHCSCPEGGTAVHTLLRVPRHVLRWQRLRGLGHSLSVKSRGKGMGGALRPSSVPKPLTSTTVSTASTYCCNRAPASPEVTAFPVFTWLSSLSSSGRPASAMPRCATAATLARSRGPITRLVDRLEGPTMMRLLLSHVHVTEASLLSVDSDMRFLACVCCAASF